MNWTLETPTRNDYPVMLSVWEASVRATHHFLTEEDIQYFKPLILEQVFDSLKLRCILEEGKILGFMGVAHHTLEALFLHPDHRGKGLGKMLVNYALEHYQITKVDVNEDNPEAVGFYLHLGFKVVDRSPFDPMGKPFPILHMVYQKSE